MMSTSFDDAGRAAIIAANLPIICLDTCTILDMMRDPRRHDIRSTDVAASLALIEAIRRGQVLAFGAQQVVLELGERFDDVRAEADKAILTLREEIANIDQIAAHFGSTGSTSLSHFDGHVDRTKKATDQLVASLTEIPQHSGITDAAYKRFLAGIAPAGRGNGNMKDCVVLETYLDAMRNLRDEGLRARVVFVSSNTNDYCDKGRRVSEAVRVDLAALDIDFVSSMSAAKGLIGF